MCTLTVLMVLLKYIQHDVLTIRDKIYLSDFVVGVSNCRIRQIVNDTVKYNKILAVIFYDFYIKILRDQKRAQCII